MTSQEKMSSKKTFTRNKRENSKNKVRPLKRRNINPGIVPRIPEFLQEFLSEESFSEIGKNILKYTNLFKSMASRLIFMTIFLLIPMFSKKYENLWWKTITARAQKRIEQEKAKNLNRNETQEKLDKNFSSKPLVKKPRGRPRKNIVTNLNNIPSQTKRKRGRPRKQIYENELPEINMQKESRIKVESDSDSDPDYLDYLKQTQTKNKKKNAKKPKNINGFKSEESENYFSTSQDKIDDIETSHEESDGENYEENLEENFEDDLEDNMKRIANRILKKILKRILRKTKKKN